MSIAGGNELQTQNYSVDKLESTHDFGKESKELNSEPNLVQANNGFSCA